MTTSKKWMYLSFALMGIIASGVLAPTALAASPTLTDIFNKLTGVDTNVTAIKARTDANLDAKVSTRATQSSVNNVQGNVTAIKTTTDANLDAKVSTRATPADITNAVIGNQGIRHAIGFLDLLDPGPDSIGVVEIIPAADGKVFTGHLTGRAFVAGALGDLAYAHLQCDVGDPTNSDIRIVNLADIDGVGPHDINVDFSCIHLSLAVGSGAPSGYDPARTRFWITGEYTETAIS